MLRKITFTLVCLIGVATPIEASQPTPVSAYSRLPAVESVKLSPSGNKVAYIQNVTLDSGEALSLLSVFDFTTADLKILLKSDNEDVRINWYRWINEDKIATSAGFAGNRRYGMSKTKVSETRLMAINVDGSGEPELVIEPRRDLENVHSQYADRVISWLPDDPEHILMEVDYDSHTEPSVFKVNVNTKKRERIERGKRKIRHWVADQQGNVRIGERLNYKDGEVIIYARQAGSEKFFALFEYNVMTDPDIIILGFGKDPNILYYKAYLNGFLALYKMRLNDQKSEVVLTGNNVDVDGGLVYSPTTREAIGVGFSQQPGGVYYWDETDAPFRDGLAAVMPDASTSIVSYNDNGRRYVLYVESENSPGVYYIGDRDRKSLSPFTGQYPELADITIPKNETITYKARDGVTIEGFLTLPVDYDGEKLPTVIFPHGGPGVRDYDGFDYWTAALVNEGYAVLRPNFRGSSGYGLDFANAADKRWGLEMQDDITDGTRWLIEKGIADPEKICMVGASYGGYASAMALVKEPELYQCGVSFAGVMDLKRLVQHYRKFINSRLVKDQIGDDYDDLEQRSPYYRINEIKAPMLLIHGESDRVVDVSQSQEMFYEMEDENKPVEYVELESGTHYLTIQRNRNKLFETMTRFLREHLLDEKKPAQ